LEVFFDDFTGDAVKRVSGGIGLEGVEEFACVVIGAIWNGVGACENGSSCLGVDGYRAECRPEGFLSKWGVFREAEACRAHLHGMKFHIFL
jgi:hypothetical protein